MDDTAAGELRRTGRALTGAAGALLFVRLPAATATDLTTTFLVECRALARRGELGDDDLVDQRDVRPWTSNTSSGRSAVPACLARGVDARRRSPCQAPFAAVFTRTTSPPLGPGTAPLMQEQARARRRRRGR